MQIGLGLLCWIVMSIALGWTFGTGMMIALVIHEFGHYFAMVKRGVPNDGIFLIPFIGGLIRGHLSSLKDEMFVVAWGPGAGVIGVYVTWMLYVLTGWHVLEVATLWGAWVNLLNLLPIYPCDGGRLGRGVLMTKWSNRLEDLRKFHIYSSLAVLTGALLAERINYFNHCPNPASCELFLERSGNNVLFVSPALLNFRILTVDLYYPAPTTKLYFIMVGIVGDDLG